MTEKVAIRPDRLFIIPPQRDLRVLRGEFHLAPISKPRDWLDVITVIFRSLDKYWTGRLIAEIVLGIDGAEALSAVRGTGGVAVAQKLGTAEQPDVQRRRRDRSANHYAVTDRNS